MKMKQIIAAVLMLAVGCGEKPLYTNIEFTNLRSELSSLQYEQTATAGEDINRFGREMNAAISRIKAMPPSNASWKFMQRVKAVKDEEATRINAVTDAIKATSLDDYAENNTGKLKAAQRDLDDFYKTAIVPKIR